MAALKFHFKRRIYVGALLGLASVAAWWVWSERAQRAASAAAETPQPFVRVGGAGAANADRDLRERAELFDPAPLFIPTDKNYGRGRLPAHLVKQPGQVFGDFGAKLTFSEGGLESYGAEDLATGESLVEVLSRGHEVPFAGLGEARPSRPKLSPRSAFLQIKKMGESELREFPVSDVAVPRADFAPLEFVVAVGAAGLIGDPLLTAGSGRDDIDGFFRDFLVRTYRLGSRLPPGRYRVVIGP